MRIIIIGGNGRRHQFFPGHIPVSMNAVCAAYLKSVLGVANGQVIRAY
jgi:hypothetical protein